MKIDKQAAYAKIRALKEESGSHSPSVATMLKEVPGLRFEIDACFLSNPYATDLFLKHLEQDLVRTGKLRDVLEYYPPQNRDIAKHISRAIDVAPEHIFVGNGAIEVIQAVLHSFVKGKICVIIPTFSSYYEFVPPDCEPVYYRLSKNDNFFFDAERYLAFVRASGAGTVVIINPNNPDGGYIPKKTLEHLLLNLKSLENIILDESFVDFAYEDSALSRVSRQKFINSYPNLTIVKSMSKDFGIAGIRAGYGIMGADRVRKLLSNGYLWNVSGLADYFFRLYGDPGFLRLYEAVRKKYIRHIITFLDGLSGISGIKVYPSKANFALVELTGGATSFDFTTRLLIDSGIYVRNCSDKIGLDGQFVRVASRTMEQNRKIISAIRAICREPAP